MKKTYKNPLILFFLMASAVSAQERTIDEWVNIYGQQEAADQVSTDQEFKDIRFGAGLCLAEHSGKKSHLDKGEPDWKVKADTFKAFMANQGNTILQKWLAGESLTAEQTKYVPLVQAAYLAHAIPPHRKEKQRYFVLDIGDRPLADCEKYFKEVNKRGDAALEKAYRTGKLSEEDVESIRLKRVAMNCTGVGGGQQLPNKLNIDGFDDFRAGDDMTDMVELLDTALTLEAALQLPDYTDEADYGYYADIFLRPAGVQEWLIDITGFEAQSLDGGQTVIRAKCPAPTNASRHLKVSENLGQRPIVLFFAGSDDCYIDDFIMAFEGMYEAYNDEVAFVYINHTINDYLMSPSNFFDHAEKHYIGNAPTVEERARVSKNLCMTAPSASFPVLMDHQSDQLKATFHQLNWNFLNLTIFVIDRNGELAAMWQEYFQVSQNANVLEQALQKLLRNDGLRDPSVEGMFVIGWQEMKDGEIPAMPSSYVWPQADPEQRRLYIRKGVVQSVESNVVTVLAKLPDGEEKIYTIQTAPFTRLQNGQETASLADLKPGVPVQVEFRADDYLGGNVTTTTTTTQMYSKRNALHTLNGNNGQLEAKRFAAHYNKTKGVRYEVYTDPNDGNITATEIFAGTLPYTDMWLYGKIVGIDRTNRTVTVARNLTDAQAMKGYRFWKEAGDAASPDPATQERLDVLDTWIVHDKAGEPQLHQFKLDDATWLTFNGDYVWDMDSFEIGDSVSANFFPGQADNPVILPDHFRVSRIGQ